MTATTDLGPIDLLPPPQPRTGGSVGALHPVNPRDQEVLRRLAWEIGERSAGDCYVPPTNFVGLSMVHPCQGFAYWRLLESWMHDVANSRGHDWDGARPILRLYDVSCITFTGLNAHRVQDEPLQALAGERFFNLPNPGTWQIAEIGFLLRNGEFIPAARSSSIPFAPNAPSRHGGHSALLVNGPGRVEPINNVWDQEQVLHERRKPHLRHPLRIAACAFTSRPSGDESSPATFVTELATGHRAHGHEVHVFVPPTDAMPADREVDGVLYHVLKGVTGASPLEQAKAYGAAVERRLSTLPPFDLIHHHDWMTATGEWVGRRPTVLSLSSLEITRRGDNPADELSKRIEETEREVARRAGRVLTPGWLRETAAQQLGVEAQAFAMEGRLPNEWEAPLDVGQVKMRFGIGPLDRLLLFVGPLEHAAGVDLMVEALPVLLRRYGNARVGLVGNGPMWGALQRRANELGVAWAVRLWGDQGGRTLTELLRSAEAVVLPSRYRIAMDDCVVDLARKAARPVVTTHGGPAHLIRHETDGLVTYDNPGSMVWALDRVLGDPGHAERMGREGRRSDGSTMRWSDVAGHYLECCVGWFPELTVTRMG